MNARNYGWGGKFMFLSKPLLQADVLVLSLAAVALLARPLRMHSRHKHG